MFATELRFTGFHARQDYIPSVLEARYSVKSLPISGLVKELFAENHEDSREARIMLNGY